MTASESLKKSIASFFKGEISDDKQTRESHSRDTSLFKVMPELVVAPKDSQDIQNLVAFATKENALGRRVTLTARSAGTDMTGGPLTEGVVVDFIPHFNQLKEIGEDYAVVEPGVYYRDFEKETLKHNLLLPCYPASREICTVGGMAANNSAGEKTLTYGKTDQFVKKLKVILRDGKEYEFRSLTLSELEDKKKLETVEGEIYRKMHALIEENYETLQKAKPNVSKNSSGYALWNVLDKSAGTFNLLKLLVGSQGTLGLNTEITFRLVRPKTHSRLLVIFMKDMKPLGHLVDKILEYKPESFESYDDHTFRIAMKLFPQIVKRLGGSIITLGFSFIPEFLKVLTGGVPKLVLLAEFTADSDAEAFNKAKAAQEGIKDFGLSSRITQTANEAKKYWVVRRESFNLLRQRVHNMRTAPFIDDLVVRPDVLPEFLPKLYEVLDQYSLTYTIAGHMGDANFHIIPLMDMTDPKSKQIIAELSDKVFALIRQFNGSNTAEHNDGLIRTSYLKEMYGPEVYSIFEKTKEIFDPQNMFNPGKKVGGDRDYALSHIETH